MLLKKIVKQLRKGVTIPLQQAQKLINKLRYRIRLDIIMPFYYLTNDLSNL